MKTKLEEKKSNTFIKSILHTIADLKILPESINTILRELSMAGKINTIILISALPIFILLLIAFGMFAYQQNKQINAEMSESVTAAGNVFHYYEAQTVMYANTFANNAVVQSQLISETPNSGPIVRAGDTIKKSADIDQLTVFNKNGDVIARVHSPIRLGDNQMELTFVRDALEKGKSTQIIILDQNKPVLQGIVPVVFEGEIIGAVAAGYELNSSFTNRIYQLTRKHIFLLINDSISATSLGNIREDVNKPTYIHRNTNSSIIKDIIFYEKGIKKSTIGYDFRYVQIGTNLSDKEIKNVGLILVIDQSGARLYLRLLVTGFIVISLLIIFIALVIALKIAKNIAKSVQRIDEGLTRISNGDLSTQIEIVSKDELGQLAGAFNQMVLDLDSSYRSLGDAKEKIQEYADQLEEKVKIRTSELQKTLEEVQNLKVQQDGDYYLTSLLTDPLSANTLDSNSSIFAEYRIIQKKKFQFKKWNKELGGDLCITHELILNQRPHVFFLNADAMGKSLQGAGGILVLGSVIQSIVERNKLDDQNKSVYPELWMRSTFIELHKVFESFGGSMLISLSMGLIDEEKGLMYYMNAEHPWTVLYRDGVASFIENDLLYRKIGTQGINSTIYVMMHQLYEGDFIIAGSDGRDDILLEIKDGVRILNEDETIFLKAIEESKGDLDKIVSYLKKIGELTDDLSLLKLEFKNLKNETIPLLANIKKLPPTLHNRTMKLYNNLKSNKTSPVEFKKFLESNFQNLPISQTKIIIQELLTSIPSLPEYITVVSNYLFEKEEFKDCIVQGERIRNLQPFNHENLNVLSQAYLKIGETKKSEKLNELVNGLKG